MNNGSRVRAGFIDKEMVRGHRDTAVLYPRHTHPIVFESLTPGGRYEVTALSVSGNKTGNPFKTSLFTSKYLVCMYVLYIH